MPSHEAPDDREIGAISQHGLVLPGGGIKEKVAAALIEKVFDGRTKSGRDDATQRAARRTKELRRRM